MIAKNILNKFGIKIYFSVIIIFALIFIIKILVKYYNGIIIDAKITETVNITTNFNRNRNTNKNFVYVEYTYKNKLYNIMVNPNIPEIYNANDKIKVILSTTNTEDIHIYSFFEFWFDLQGLVWFIVNSTIWTIIYFIYHEKPWNFQR